VCILVIPMIMLGRLGVGGFGHITEIRGVGLGGDNGTSSLRAESPSSTVELSIDLNNLRNCNEAP
jgi:hypothetical protein